MLKVKINMMNDEYNKRIRVLRQRVRLCESYDGKLRFMHSYADRDASSSQKKIPRTDIHSKGKSRCDESEASSQLEAKLHDSQGLCGIYEDSVDFSTSVELSRISVYRENLFRCPESTVLVHPKVLAIARSDSSGQKLSNFYHAVVKVSKTLLCSCNTDIDIAISNSSYALQSKLCNHLTVAQETELIFLLDDWFSEEEHSYGQISSHNPVTNVFPVTDTSVLVLNDCKFSSVTIVNGLLRCSCCKSSGYCPAIQLVKDSLKQPEIPASLLSFKDFLELEPDVIVCRDRSSVSTKPVRFTSPMKCDDRPAIIYINSCTSCGSAASGMLRSEILCFDLIASYTVSVETFTCSNCNILVQPDGGDEGVINMGDYVMTHTVLRDYLKLFLSDGLSLYGYYRKWCWTLIERGYQVPTYYQVRIAWDSFCRLLPVEQYFSCPECGSSPKTIICDGLTLGFKKRHRLPPENVKVGTAMNGCILRETLVIQNKVIRNSIHELTSKKQVCTDDIKKLKALVANEVDFLVNPLDSFMATECVPKHWQYLLSQLSKSSPAAGVLCKYDVLQKSLEDFIDSPSGDKLQAIRHISPMIFKFIKEASVIDIKMFMPIAACIIKKTQYIQQTVPHLLPVAQKHEKLISGYFPSLPKLFERGHFKMDKGHGHGSSSDSNCSKYGKQQKYILPGICYGFDIMDSHESPNSAFTVLRTRLMTAPDRIIYDNACNLHKYAISRDPGFFKNSLFLVDHFHWQNHRACCSGYNISSYPNLDSINTQVAEQRNSTLNRLKSSLSYMHQENFFTSLSVFLSFRNAINILKLREPLDDDELVIKKLIHLYSR